MNRFENKIVSRGARSTRLWPQLKLLPSARSLNALRTGRLALSCTAAMGLGLLASDNPAHAQDQPQDAVDAVDADGATDANSAETRTGTRTNGGLVLSFQDASLQSVLEFLSEEAGLIVVNDVVLDDRINVVSHRPVSLEEAIDLLNTLLKEQGYTAILRERLLRIVDIDDAARENIPVSYGNDPNAIPMTDRIVTHIIPIRYAGVEDLARDIEPLIGSGFSELSANESSNSLILTDTQANIRRIVEIVQAVDQSISSVTDVEVFRLQFADAQDTARLIEDVFQESGPSEAETLGRSIQQRFGGGRGGGGNDEETQTAQASEVKASADERTNSVVVSASSDIMEVIRSMITELDADSTEQESVLIYKVRHLDAETLEATFDALFESLADEEQFTGNAQQGGRGGFQQAAATNTSDSASGDSLVGEVTTVANTDTNTLLILTAERNFARVESILESLDQPIPQVLIRVLIAEVTLDDDLDAGVEWQALGLADNVQALFTNFNVNAATEGINLTFLDRGDLAASVRILQEVGKLDVLSRPYILASDNQEANISIGQEVPFITNTRETDEGNTINTIEYRDIGIILGVTPRVNDENQVTLNISQELSALTGTTVPISEELDAVVIANREANTTVSVNNGQTIVIGGLMQDEYTETISQVPILGDIPIIGHLFRRTQVSKGKTELLIFLTPEIAGVPTELDEITERIQREAEAVQNAIRPGVLRDHLNRLRARRAELELVRPDLVPAAPATSVPAPLGGSEGVSP